MTEMRWQRARGRTGPLVLNLRWVVKRGNDGWAVEDMRDNRFVAYPLATQREARVFAENLAEDES